MNKKHEIKDMLKVIMQHFKLKKGIDYVIKNGELRMVHIKGVTGVILVTLKENFPQFNFYWESPRILKWF